MPKIVHLDQFRAEYLKESRGAFGRMRGMRGWFSDDDDENNPTTQIQTGVPHLQAGIEAVRQKSIAAACGEGEIYDFETDRCVPGEYAEVECPEGFEWDSTAWECVPVAVPGDGPPVRKTGAAGGGGGGGGGGGAITPSTSAKALVLGGGAVLGGILIGGLSYAGASVSGSKNAGKIGAGGALAGAIAGAAATYYATVST